MALIVEGPGTGSTGLVSISGGSPALVVVTGVLTALVVIATDFAEDPEVDGGKFVVRNGLPSG